MAISEIMVFPMFEKPSDGNHLYGGSVNVFCNMIHQLFNQFVHVAGRLLLPTLDFWRNQIPVYDEVSGISGIFPILHFLDCDSTCSDLANTVH